MTRDSFFSSSRVTDLNEIRARARKIVVEGADIIDLGGESSRPGSDYVSSAEELKRVVPAVETIRADHPELEISVDTRKAAVAQAALDAGATMINDISGLRDDPELAPLIAERNVPVCIMHMRGTPRTMQMNPVYNDVIGEICSELGDLVEGARQAGIRAEQIILDPGIGFGKTFSHNWEILRNLKHITGIGYPVLIGLSRKSFLGAISRDTTTPAIPPEERLNATIAAQIWCTLQGVSFVRVHDVRPMEDALNVLERLLPST